MLTYKHGIWGPSWWILGLLLNSHHCLHFMSQSHWAPCGTLKVPYSHLHDVHFVKTSLPVSLNIPAFLILSHLIWLIKIHPSKCQQIVLDLCCWLLLYLELTFIIALIMLKNNHVPTKLWITQETELCLICLEHPALCLAHDRCLKFVP